MVWNCVPLLCMLPFSPRYFKYSEFGWKMSDKRIAYVSLLSTSSNFFFAPFECPLIFSFYLRPLHFLLYALRIVFQTLLWIHEIPSRNPLSCCFSPETGPSKVIGLRAQRKFFGTSQIQLCSVTTSWNWCLPVPLAPSKNPMPFFFFLCRICAWCFPQKQMQLSR